MIQIKQLTHLYPRRKRAPFRALSGFSLSIDPHIIFALTGPNGGGKSTLFRILCGLTRPSAGTVWMAGVESVHNPAAARRLLGVVFQHPALDKQLTVLENLRIHAHLHGVDNTTFDQRLRSDLGWSGLEPRLHDRVGTLSGGTARRVELVKALLHRPQILLLDEPTNGLDPGGRRDFMETLLRLRREQGLTVLMTSHLFDEAEQADQVGILHQGTLLAVGTPDGLRSTLGEEMVIIQTRQAEEALALQLILQQHAGLQVIQREQELRISGIDRETLQQLLLHHRERFQSLVIQHPTLEDVFIHHTRVPHREEVLS
ncbi:MAG: ABC transporter ATP-binding protein [Magnetococcales bacterium]|nr:ABC transporter ATP-binding protein [Magnetococcales bacterium]